MATFRNKLGTFCKVCWSGIWDMHVWMAIGLLVLILLLWSWIGWNVPGRGWKALDLYAVDAGNPSVTTAGDPRHPTTQEAAIKQEADLQSLRGQWGDQFGAVNSLFAALAFTGVLIGLYIQHKSHHRELYSARLQALIEHFKTFHSADMFRARVASWNSIRRALTAAEIPDINYRWQLARYNSVSRELTGGKVQGYYFEGKTPMPLATPIVDAATVTARSWHDDAHSVEEVISFFTIMAIHIESAQSVANPAEKQKLRRIVLNMPTYWDWWGPMLRYIIELRTRVVNSDVNLIYSSEPEANELFDTLDSHALRIPKAAAAERAGKGIVDASTRLDSEHDGLEILRRIAAIEWNYFDATTHEVAVNSTLTATTLKIDSITAVATEADRGKFFTAIGLLGPIGTGNEPPHPVGGDTTRKA